MNRRGFLKGIAAGVVLASPAVRALSELPGNAAVIRPVMHTGQIITNPDLLREGMLIINRDARTIGFTAAAEKTGMEVRALYSYLKEAWKDDVDGLLHEPFPMMGIHPEYMIMQDEWSIDWARGDALRLGCIEEMNGDRYAAMIGLGTWDTPQLHMARNELPRVEIVPAHTCVYGESHLVKLTKDDEKLTWLNFGEDHMLPMDDPAWFKSDRNTKISTADLGIKHAYHGATGSLRFPKPFGYTMEPKIPPPPNQQRVEIKL